MTTKILPAVTLFKAMEKSSLNGKPASLGAFNVNFYAQAEGILEGITMADAPAVIQASRGANKFQGGPKNIQAMINEALKNSGAKGPITLHLDHGTKETAFECVDIGFSSVMIDVSKLDYEANIEVSKEVADYAHAKGLSVEAEYGQLAGIEEDIQAEKTTYADPNKIIDFIKRSGTDSLAIAYGTSHGPNKGQTNDVDISIVANSYQALKDNKMNENHFLVSHGSSTVPQHLVEEINKYGGTLEGASGVAEEKLQEAVAAGIRKINIDTDLRLDITAAVRKYLAENPNVEEKSELVGRIKKVFTGETASLDKEGKAVEPGNLIDPRSYLKPIMELDPKLLREDYRNCGDEAYIELMNLIKDRVALHVKRLCEVFGSAGLASKVDLSLDLKKMAKHY